MCGRFYIEDDLMEDLELLLQRISNNARKERIRVGEVYPTNEACVLMDDKNDVEILPWGFPGREKKVIFNARSETVLQKRMFEQGFLKHRCLVPVSGFFEWNKKKQKYYFTAQESRVLYLAGIMDTFQGKKYFTILTRDADEVMSPIHNRMPVIINKEKKEEWFDSLEQAKKLLYQRQIRLNPRLEQKKEAYEQLHIFNTFEK